ncbi:group I intron-associated PD-(D/E)XK endonuclease [Roseibium sp. RKSG952]|uniref:group I intron-associated PD-(D/E)XK endonuclease n=1 Tax=Roseibium sp. RKSG952 TaxID=2529384 RepID=UPI0012BCE350|nr:group I intron-associated PD-(D/E)XK endonuclease [Roseibium sp. RKSG952]MTH96006.1 hypothetical protein [Roseibium sp. RKSG952]
MPKKSHHTDKKPEVIRLRAELRLGMKEIRLRTGVPQSTLHHWLKDHPLTEQEQRDVIVKAPRYVAPKKALNSEGRTPLKIADDISTSRLGAAAECFVKGRLNLLNLTVVECTADGDVVDVYVRRDGGQRVAFIQVRVTQKPENKAGLPYISLRRYRKGRSNNFNKGDFHFLAGYCRENDSAYVFSFDEVKDKVNTVTIREEARETWEPLIEWLERQDALLEQLEAA